MHRHHDSIYRRFIMEQNPVSAIFSSAANAVLDGRLRVSDKDVALKLIDEAGLIVKADPGIYTAACSNPDSLKDSIRQMLRWNLSLEKNQCYLTVQGACRNPTVALRKSYMGIQTIIKRLYPNIDRIFASEVREGEDVSLGEVVNGIPTEIRLINSLLSTRDNPIIGAYAGVVDMKGKIISYALMSRKELDLCHETSKGFSPVYKKYPGEMSKKTVLLRALKPLFRTSDNQAVLMDYFDDDEKKIQSHIDSMDHITVEEEFLPEDEDMSQPDE